MTMNRSKNHLKEIGIKKDRKVKMTLKVCKHELSSHVVS